MELRDLRHACDRAREGHVEHVEVDVLVVERGAVEVVAGDTERRDAAADGLEERIEAQVVDVRGVAAARLEVDDQHPGLRAPGASEHQVGLGLDDDAPVAEVDPHRRLEARDPAGRERGERVEEPHDPLVGLGPQLGARHRRRAPEPLTGPPGVVEVVLEPLDGGVDQLERRPVLLHEHGELDGLVRHGAPRRARRPAREALPALGHVVRLAAVDLHEVALAHEELAGAEPLGHRRQARLERVAQPDRQLGLERGTGPPPRHQLVDHALLDRREGARAHCTEYAPGP